MDLRGLSVICAGLGFVEEDANGAPIGYKKSESCLENLKDLQRFLRRDDPQTRDVFKQVCKWNTVSNDLVPIIEHCQNDRNLIVTAVKILVFLTMPIDPASSDISQQIEYLWILKKATTRNDTIAVIVSLLEEPLEHLERDAFTEDDWKLVQLVLTLFRNILSIQDITLHQKASGAATQYLYLRDRFLELLFHENVMDLILVLSQHVAGSCGYLHQDNLLLLETFYYIFLGQDPELIAKASQKGSEVNEDIKISISSLQSMMEEEEKRRLIRLRNNLSRHSQFSGTFSCLTMDGSKSLFKGNPATASGDGLLKAHKVQRGPQKRIAWDQVGLTLPKENIVELLHQFINQFLSGGYNVLMQSIREDIEQDHHSIQNSDVITFFQVADFVTAFQHHKSLILKPNMESSTPKGSPINQGTDCRIFCGDVCGPIAATMNESMFGLVISKWRDAFENLKEPSAYKFLSAIGSLMKGMIRMLDLVLKFLPEDSKEPQTARILLYKIFYDQTDQGLTQFLVNLVKSFDVHKQPKSDLADLVEVMHLILQLMENLQSRGTLRVAKKSRKGRKKKNHANKIASQFEKIVEEGVTDPKANSSDHDIAYPTGEPLEKIAEEYPNITKSDDLIQDIGNAAEPVGKIVENDNKAPQVDAVIHGASNYSRGPFMDSNKSLDGCLEESNYNGKEGPGVCDLMAEEPGKQLPDTFNLEGKSIRVDGGKFNNDLNDLSDGTDYSSDDDQTTVTNEVDFNVSKFVAIFGSNTIIQNLCWLLKFYKSNSESTNHQIISILQRICDDLELSPMLYQLSLLTTFYDIINDQKSHTCKEYENIISFLTKLVRKLMKKMKSQPLLFVEVLFWKTRKECHYINSQSLLYKLGNLKKETSKWQSISADEVEVGSSNGVGFARRSIADALGEDEHDLVNSLEIDHQSEQSSWEESQKTSRKKSLSFDEDQENDANILYEKFKDNQPGIKAGRKKKVHEADEPFASGGDLVSTEGTKIASNDSLPSHELEDDSLSKKLQSRKRVQAFSKEQEVMLKDLFEQFKNHKRCNQMIANALDADNAYTAAQVSRKLRQLGLRDPQKKRQSDAENLTGQQEGADSIKIDGKELSDEETLLSLKKKYQNKRKFGAINLSGENNTGKAEPSDEETLLSLKERGKGKAGVKLIRKESTKSAPSKRKMVTRLSQEDDADDEVLSTVFSKSAKWVGMPKVDNFEAPSGWETISGHELAARAHENMIQSDVLAHCDATSPSQDATAADYLAKNLDDADVELAKSDVVKQLDVVHEGAEHSADIKHTSQQNYDDLEDSGDDVVGILPNNIPSRRKLKMVIDFEDDD